MRWGNAMCVVWCDSCSAWLIHSASGIRQNTLQKPLKKTWFWFTARVCVFVWERVCIYCSVTNCEVLYCPLMFKVKILYIAGNNHTGALKLFMNLVLIGYFSRRQFYCSELAQDFTVMCKYHYFFKMSIGKINKYSNIHYKKRCFKGSSIPL